MIILTNEYIVEQQIPLYRKEGHGVQKNNKKFIYLMITICLVLVVGFIISMIQYYKRVPTINKETHSTIEATNQKNVVEQINNNNMAQIENEQKKRNAKLLELKKEEVVFAIFGTDERSSETPRSDIIMLVRYIPMEEKMILVSVPRDTRVSIPTKYEDKINHAYAFGGAELLEQTLEELFETKIDYYIKLSFDNFESLIDALGGVEVFAKKDYEYPGYIHISKGKQILDGENALDYVRFRYDHDGDQGRIERQQEVIQSLVNHQYGFSQEETIDLIKEFYPQIQTNMALSKAIDYYQLIELTDTYQFDRYTLSTKGAIIENIWYEIYDRDDLDRLINVLNK